MSSIGAAPRAAVPVSSARAEASRKNGAQSRGPKTLEGTARAAQNALKHGLRAQKHVVLPDEDAAEFAGLEAALLAEVAPIGALQTVLARRGAIAAWPSRGPIAWPPERGWGPVPQLGGQEAELFAERRWADAGLGLALIRDGNGTRSFETLMRYRGAAMAEFWRALRTLKALQARGGDADGRSRAASGDRPASGAKRTRALCRAPGRYVVPEPPTPGRALHEAAAPAPAPSCRTNPTAAGTSANQANRAIGRA